jgi:hypothetical protein
MLKATLGNLEAIRPGTVIRTCIANDWHIATLLMRTELNKMKKKKEF